MIVVCHSRSELGQSRIRGSQTVDFVTLSRSDESIAMFSRAALLRLTMTK